MFGVQKHFKAALAEIEADVTAYITENLVMLAKMCDIPADTQNPKFRTFGPQLIKQWMGCFSLRTGSNPALALTPKGLENDILKRSFEARYVLRLVRVRGFDPLFRCSGSMLVTAKWPSVGRKL